MKNSATVARVISRVFTYAWHWRGMLGEVAPLARLNSPTFGQVKFPQAGQRRL